MTRTKAKVLFIGLDSAEPNLVLDWCDSGVLPIMQSLKERSVWGITKTPVSFGNGVLWPCMFTGVNPAKHGRYFFRQIHPGTYKATDFHDDSDLKAEPLWSQLSRAGRKVCVIDMVRAPLTRDLNGVQIADWLAHDRTSEPRSWPPEIISEIIAQYGDDPFNGMADEAGRGAAEYTELCRLILERVKTKTDMSCNLLNKGPWDLFMTVYADPHDIGHQCWHLHDSEHPNYDRELVGEIGNPIKTVYSKIDEGIGRLLNEIGPETNVVLFTGPGMESGYTVNFLLDQILRRIESPGKSDGRTFVDTLKTAYRATVPPALRNHLQSFAQRNEEAMLVADRRSRKCFAVPHNENSGAIRINLVGREPDGKIKPGRECDLFCEELTRELMAIKNLETGDPLIKEVVRISETFKGEHVNELPDLMTIWNRPSPIRVIGSPRIGEIRANYPGSRTGDHTPRGLFFASGPNIVPSELERNVSVMDVGASVSALLGVTLENSDGVPIEEVTQASTPCTTT